MNYTPTNTVLLSELSLLLVYARLSLCFALLFQSLKLDLFQFLLVFDRVQKHSHICIFSLHAVLIAFAFLDDLSDLFV